MRINRVTNYQTPKEVVRKKLGPVEPLAYTVNIFTDKDRVRFIKEVERRVRTSMEYKDYVQYLKDNIQMNMCAFFQNITNQGRKFSIHIHHEPFTLWDITSAVVNRYEKEGIPYNYFTIAEEVMRNHYQNRVGLIPLSVTPHELYHDGQLFIPLQAVYGNFINFLAMYDEYIDNETKAILHAKMKMSRETVHDFTVLDKRYVYLVMPDSEELKPIEL